MGIQVFDMQNTWQRVFVGDLDFKRFAKEQLGYESFTTFWSDFTIAEHFGGMTSIKETFDRAFAEWKCNYKYFTELVLVLKTKSGWFEHKKNEGLAELYGNQYCDAYAYALEHLIGDELSYFKKVFGIIDAAVSVKDDEDFRSFAQSELGYTCLTSYWSEFSAAERSGGVVAVKSLFNRLFDKSKDDYKLLTELVLVLNHKIWKCHSCGHMELAKLYNLLWEQADTYGITHLEGEELCYFYQTLD